MKKLKELIDLLTINKLKSIEIIDHRVDSDTKLSKLYHGIRENKFKEDEAAWKSLYPTAKSKNAYYKLKHSLRDRLFNTLFFVDVKSNKYSDIHRAKLNLQKISHLLNILQTKGLKQNAIDIAKKGLKIAEQYEFIEEQLNFACFLRSQAAVINGDQEEFFKYSQLAERSADLLRSEVKIEGIVQETLMLYTNDKSTKAYLSGQIEDRLKALKPFAPERPTATWIYHHALLEIARDFSNNNYAQALTICELALEKIKNFPFIHTKSIINISAQAVACCLQLRKFKKGEALLLDGLKIMQPGIFNWFKYKELYMMICIHSGQYQKALNIYTEASDHTNFDKLPNNAIEVWKIFEAWLYFLSASGYIVSTRILSRFKLARYLNDFQIFSKDKSGLNVAIMISQIALMVLEKKYDHLIDKKEAINRYKDRYIDKDTNLRSNIFINMLLKIPSADFNQSVVIKKTTKEFQQLEKAPLKEARQSEYIEIFPYQVLWKILLKTLS